MHGKDTISLGYNTYIGMPSIQTTDHQSYRPRFWRICRLSNHSQGDVDCNMMYQWSWMDQHPFSRVLWMHRNDLTSLDCHPYTGMPSIQAIDLPRYGPRTGRVCRVCRIPRHPQGGVGYIPGTSGHGWVVIHFTCLVNTWERYHKPGM